ncbi:hypothetical protein NFI96_032011 [Prochilodus magdalenae]|nr:hypothetical protein NFI96_032011 [Prochilodus magdalenae]
MVCLAGWTHLWEAEI